MFSANPAYSHCVHWSDACFPAPTTAEYKLKLSVILPATFSLPKAKFPWSSSDPASGVTKRDWQR